MLPFTEHSFAAPTWLPQEPIRKFPIFYTPERLEFLQDTLLQLAEKYQWALQAWAIFSNHYHFIAQSPSDPKTLSAFLSNLHVATAKYVNAKDNKPNRQVWWQYWDSLISYQIELC
jgi:putative transposase